MFYVRRIVGTIATLLLVGTAPALAGEEAGPETGSITGVVARRAPGPASTAPVVDAVVRVHTGDEEGPVVTAPTGADGSYQLHVDAGTYRVEFAAPDHDAEWAGGAHAANVRVTAGSHLTIDALLEPSHQPAGFSDVDSEVTDWARQVGIVRGYRDGTVRPTTALTRGQAVLALWRLHDTPAATAALRHRDVRRRHWLRPALRWATEAGVATHLAPGRRFNPTWAVAADRWARALEASLGKPADCPLAGVLGPTVTRLEAFTSLHAVAGSGPCWSETPDPLPHTTRFDERSTTILADGFDRPDAPIAGSIAPTGARWRSFGFNGVPDSTNEGVIVDGQVATPHAGASYNWVELDRAPDQAEMRFTIGPGATGGGASGLIVSGWRAPATGMEIAQHSVHVAVSSTATAISLYDGQYEDPVYRRFFAAPLTADGHTEHTITVRRTEDTLTVTNPDGSVEIFADPRVSESWGGTVLVEPYRPAASWLTDQEHRIADVSAVLVSRT